MSTQFGKKLNPNMVNVPGAGQFGKRPKFGYVEKKPEIEETIEIPETPATIEEVNVIENMMEAGMKLDDVKSEEIKKPVKKMRSTRGK